MVLVKNKLYKVHIQDSEYMGKAVEQKILLPLDEEVPDGPYLAEGYIPRMLFSFNNVVFTEFLKPMSPEELEIQKAKEAAQLEKIIEERRAMGIID